MREITYREALNEALSEEMARDENVFIIGEDVGIYGGAYGVTRGLYDKFGPERVRDSAISEAAIAGAAAGAAMMGMRPVAEIMYIDFSTIALDAVANIAAKNRYMFGGKTSVPMVLRTEGGTGRGIAAHHSQSLEAMFAHFPGLYVVMPATPYDAKGLLKAAIRNDNPVVFIEHKMLYGKKGPCPEEDYELPIGKAEVKREGADITIVTYSNMLYLSLSAAEELAGEGISCEVVDLRTVKPVDIETVASSVEKTGRAIVVSEGYKTCGVAAEVMALIVENCFDSLDAPPARITGKDVPIPMSPVLEEVAIPRVVDIVRKAKELV